MCGRAKVQTLVAWLSGPAFLETHCLSEIKQSTTTREEQRRRTESGRSKGQEGDWLTLAFGLSEVLTSKDVGE